MNRKRSSIIVSLVSTIIICVITCGSAIAFTDDLSRTEIQWFSEDETRKQAEEYRIQFGKDEHVHSAFSEFAIAPDGRYAISFESKDKKYINVYNQSGEFMYCYAFETDAYKYVIWENDELYVLFSRSNIVVCLNDSGECIAAGKWINSKENRALFLGGSERSECFLDGVRYFSSSVYDKRNPYGDQKYLFREENGERTIIYQAEPETEQERALRLSDVWLGRVILFFLILYLIFVYRTGGFKSRYGD